MFSWSADTVRFMADACRRTDFHEKLTALLLPYLKPTDHICDAGCGLGYLSLALSPHAARVTAAERDAAALAVLRQELDARGVANVTPLCAAGTLRRHGVLLFRQHGGDTGRRPPPVPWHGAGRGA